METNAAVTFEKSAEFQIVPLQFSDPNDEEILVPIVGAGICHIDSAAHDQHLPIPLPSVLGHEGADVVEQIGGG